MWLAAQKYYLEYLAAISILTKIGIKSKKHVCTVRAIRMLETQKIIDFPFSKILEKDRRVRINNQYRLKNEPVEFDIDEMSRFLQDIKAILKKISREEIEMVRNIIKGL